MFDPSQDKGLIPQISQIHADCITHDHQLATFLPPLDQQKMISYWEKVVARVENGDAALILQFAPESNDEVAGYVVLGMPNAETGPFRGDVLKLMVSTKYRRMGVARRLMTKLEEIAREKHRELLVCHDFSNRCGISRA